MNSVLMLFQLWPNPIKVLYYPRFLEPCYSPVAGGEGQEAGAGHWGADWRRWRHCLQWPLKVECPVEGLVEEKRRLMRWVSWLWQGRLGRVNLNCLVLDVSRWTPQGCSQRIWLCWGGYVGSDSVYHRGRTQRSWRCGTELHVASTPWSVVAAAGW